MVAPQHVAHTINIDPASVRNIWFYLRPDKDVPSDDKINAMGFEMVSELSEEVKASIPFRPTPPNWPRLSRNAPTLPPKNSLPL